MWYDVAEVRGLSGNTIGLHQARAEYFALVGDYDQAVQQLDYAKQRAGTNCVLASKIDARQREMLEQQRMIKEMMR
ncbi:Beta-barrel assembly-enhancing protease [compost metagenome]